MGTGINGAVSSGSEPVKSVKRELWPLWFTVVDVGLSTHETLPPSLRRAAHDMRMSNVVATVASLGACVRISFPAQQRSQGSVLMAATFLSSRLGGGAGTAGQLLQWRHRIPSPPQLATLHTLPLRAQLGRPWPVCGLGTVRRAEAEVGVGAGTASGSRSFREGASSPATRRTFSTSGTFATCMSVSLLPVEILRRG